MHQLYEEFLVTWFHIFVEKSASGVSYKGTVGSLCLSRFNLMNRSLYMKLESTYKNKG